MIQIVLAALRAHNNWHLMSRNGISCFGLWIACLLLSVILNTYLFLLSRENYIPLHLNLSDSWNSVVNQAV
jgi:hypothetical protein